MFMMFMGSATPSSFSVCLPRNTKHAEKEASHQEYITQRKHDQCRTNLAVLHTFVELAVELGSTDSNKRLKSLE